MHTYIYICMCMYLYIYICVCVLYTILQACSTWIFEMGGSNFGCRSNCAAPWQPFLACQPCPERGASFFWGDIASIGPCGLPWQSPWIHIQKYKHWATSLTWCLDILSTGHEVHHHARPRKKSWFWVFSKRHHDVAASVGRMEQRPVQSLADVLALAHADPWLWQPKTTSAWHSDFQK